MLRAGHVAVRAAGGGDLALVGLIGVAAFPKSPFPVSLVISVLLLLAGLGL